MTLILASFWKNSVTDVLEVPEGQALNYGDHIYFIAGFHVRLCEEKTVSSKKKRLTRKNINKFIKQ